MKLRRNKKGFTMVELIIVIAVIAVLTAILVPTFIHLANKAGDASDKTIVKNANTQLALKAAQGRRNTSMSEAVKDVDEIGYHMSGVSTSNGNQICWDRLNDRFVLFNKDNQIILSDGERTQPTTAEEFADFFKPVSNFADAGQFTPYAKSGFSFEGSGVTLSEGTLALGARSLDIGELEGVTVVNVNDADAAGTYLVGTGNTNVTVNVNVPKGTVYHLGVSKEVIITGIKGDSYHEFGRVGFAEMNSNGRYVAEKGAEVKALWFSDANAKYTKESGATVNEYAPTTAIKAAIEAQLTNDDVIVSDNEEGVRDAAIEAITEEINKEEGVEPVTPDGDPISNFADMQAAFANGGEYYIATDSLEITSPLTTSKTVSIDLNGKTVNVNSNANPSNKCVIVASGGTIVFKDSGENGCVLNTKSAFSDAIFGFISGGTIQIDGGTFLSTNDCLFGGIFGTFRFNDGTINGFMQVVALSHIYMNKLGLSLTYLNDTGNSFESTDSTVTSEIATLAINKHSSGNHDIYTVVAKA